MWIDDIKNLILERENVNVITVDWNQGATNLNYFKVVHNTKKVADILTKLVDQMLVRNS